MTGEEEWTSEEKQLPKILSRPSGPVLKSQLQLQLQLQLQQLQTQSSVPVPSSGTQVSVLPQGLLYQPSWFGKGS